MNDRIFKTHYFSNSKFSKYFTQGRKKKTQISLFILVSMIIVIGALFFIYQSDNINILNQDNEEEIYVYVRECLDLTAKRGMEEIGLHGGWLYTRENYQYADRDTVPILVKSMAGFQDIGGIKHTYWYYYDDSKKEFSLRVPSWNDEHDDYSIRAQLNRYIDEHLEKDCINGFKVFRERYEIEYNPREIKSDITFKKDDIYINSKFNLKISPRNEDKVFFYNDFELKLFNYMLRPFYHALALIESQDKDSYIDMRIWQMISPYQNMHNRDELPPVNGFQMNEFDIKPWKVDEVNVLVKQILESNMRYITFMHSMNQPESVDTRLQNNQLAQALNVLYYKDYIGINNSVMDEIGSLSDDFYNDDVTIDFKQFYPMYLKLAGALGNMYLFPEPESFFGGILPFFWTSYETEYKLTGPVLLQIESYYENGETYELNIPIEFNIEHNEPLRHNIVDDRFGFLDDIRDALNSVSDVSDNIICSPTQRLSKPVYFELIDPVKNSGIDEALISFDCKDTAECFIGETKSGYMKKKSAYSGDLIFVNSSYFETKLPVDCDPGTLKIYKHGYQRIEVPNVNPNYQNEIDLGTIYMPSAKTFQVRIKKAFFSDTSTKPLEEHENAIILFQNLEDETYIRVVKANYTNADFEDLEIDLIPGMYDIKGYIFYDDVVHIPEEEVCWDGGIFGGGEDCETLEAIDLEGWLRGGINMPDFNVSLSHVVHYNKFTIYLADIGLPSNYDELADSSALIEKVINNPSMTSYSQHLLPKFQK